MSIEVCAGEDASTPEPATIDLPAEEWAQLKLCGARIVTITKDEYIDLLRANLYRYRALETPPGPQARYTPETAAKIHQLHAQGLSIRQIAHLAKCGRTTVELILKGGAHDVE